MDFSILTTVDNIISANLLRTKLESEGIPCFLNNENFTNLMPLYFNIFGSGVQIMVPNEKIEQAKKILNIHQGSLTCPNCDSRNIKNESENKKSKLKLFLISIFLAGLIGNLLNDYVCKDCGHQFKRVNA